MFTAGLILLESLPVPVEAQQSDLVALALLDLAGDGGAADDELLVLYAGEVAELFELRDESGSVVF